MVRKLNAAMAAGAVVLAMSVGHVHAQQPVVDISDSARMQDFASFLTDSVKSLANQEINVFDRKAMKMAKSKMTVLKVGAPQQVSDSTFRMGFTAKVQTEGKPEDVKVMLAEFYFNGNPLEKRLVRIALMSQAPDGSWMDYAGQQKYGEIPTKVNPNFPIAGAKP